MYSMPMTARKADVTPPPEFTPAKVYQVREQLGVSQAVMAKLLNVSAPAVRAWEQPKSKGKPSGAAARLLEIAAKHPQVVLGSMSAKPSSRKQPASSRRGSLSAALKRMRKRA
jgi:DNA-binding transcriptional regulator YiaG